MHPIIFLIIVVAVLLAVSWIKRQPAARRRNAGFKAALAAAGGILLLALLTGRLTPLIVALSAAIPMLQRLMTAKSIFDQLKSARGPARGKSSAVSTRFMDMTLDHDSGEMSGTVREGRFQGRTLASMSFEQLMSLLDECRAVDAQSAAVLEAFLDRYHGAQWRDGAAAAGAGRGGDEPGARSPTGAMTAAEARQILGVGADADQEAILAAHRRLMQKLHPDRGGSDYLAAKINQAKDCLVSER